MRCIFLCFLNGILNLENMYINVQQNVCEIKLPICVRSPQHGFEFTYCELGLPGWLQELDCLSRGAMAALRPPFVQWGY